MAYGSSRTGIVEPDQEMSSVAIHEKRNVQARLPRSCSGSPQDHSGEEQNLHGYTA